MLLQLSWFFPLHSPSTQHPPLPQAIPPPLFMSMGHACKFFVYSISCNVLYMAILLSRADQQPTLDTVRMDEMRLHSRGSCGSISCISLLACLSLLLLGGGIFEHLYFGSTDLQNSNSIVQNDFLAIEQKSLRTPPQPTSPTYWKINIRLWAG